MNKTQSITYIKSINELFSLEGLIKSLQKFFFDFCKVCRKKKINSTSDVGWLSARACGTAKPGNRLAGAKRLTKSISWIKDPRLRGGRHIPFSSE